MYGRWKRSAKTHFVTPKKRVYFVSNVSVFGSKCPHSAFSLCQQLTQCRLWSSAHRHCKITLTLATHTTHQTHASSCPVHEVHFSCFNSEHTLSQWTCLQYVATIKQTCPLNTYKHLLFQIPKKTPPALNISKTLDSLHNRCSFSS